MTTTTDVHEDEMTRAEFYENVERVRKYIPGMAEKAHDPANWDLLFTLALGIEAGDIAYDGDDGFGLTDKGRARAEAQKADAAGSFLVEDDL